MDIDLNTHNPCMTYAILQNPHTKVCKNAQVQKTMLGALNYVANKGLLDNLDDNGFRLVKLITPPKEIITCGEFVQDAIAIDDTHSVRHYTVSQYAKVWEYLKEIRQSMEKK